VSEHETDYFHNMRGERAVTLARINKRNSKGTKNCPSSVRNCFIMFFYVFSTVHHGIQLFH